MIIGALGFQPERRAAMDFTVPFNRAQVTMWILNPRLRRQIWLALFDMVDLAVMGLLLGTMFVLAILLATTSKLLLNHHCRKELDSGVVNNGFTLLGAILNQGKCVICQQCFLREQDYEEVKISWILLMG